MAKPIESLIFVAPGQSARELVRRGFLPAITNEAVGWWSRADGAIAEVRSRLDCDDIYFTHPIAGAAS